MSLKDLYPLAHKVLDALADRETPGPNVDNPDAWRKTVRHRLRGEHWATIIGLLEDDPTLDPIKLAEDLAAPKPAPKWGAPEPVNTSALLPTVTAETWEPLPPEERERSVDRLRAIRASLKENAQ